MKVSGVCNGSLTISANVKKDGDYAQACAVAARMELDSDGVIVRTSECPHEQWVLVCSAWTNYQASELRDAYNSAKKIIQEAS